MTEYLIKKPCTYEAITINLNKFKSCNATLRMLLVYVGIYLKSVLRCTFLIFWYSSSADTLSTWARLWGSVVTFRNKKGSARKKNGEHWASMLWIFTMWSSCKRTPLRYTTFFDNVFWRTCTMFFHIFAVRIQSRNTRNLPIIGNNFMFFGKYGFSCGLD